MKRTLIILSFILPVIVMTGCQDSTNKVNLLQARIDSLQARLDTAYVPAIGETMNGIVQPHHYKLWMAGSNKNWLLAEYERQELAAGFKRIQKYHRNSAEGTAVAMIYPEIDELKTALKAKDAAAFTKHFGLLTNACNTCHKAMNREYNVITVPTGPSFGNQRFQPAAK